MCISLTLSPQLQIFASRHPTPQHQLRFDIVRAMALLGTAQLPAVRRVFS